jgi:hypothetical protein
MKRLLNVRASKAPEGELVLHEIHPLHPTHTARIMGGDVVKVGRSPAVEAMLETGILIDVDEENEKPAQLAKPAKTAGKDKD